MKRRLASPDSRLILEVALDISGHSDRSGGISLRFPMSGLSFQREIPRLRLAQHPGGTRPDSARNDGNFGTGVRRPDVGEELASSRPRRHSRPHSEGRLDGSTRRDARRREHARCSPTTDAERGPNQSSGRDGNHLLGRHSPWRRPVVSANPVSGARHSRSGVGAASGRRGRPCARPRAQCIPPQSNGGAPSLRARRPESGLPRTAFRDMPACQ
jgi:hypothetical protein